MQYHKIIRAVSQDHTCSITRSYVQYHKTTFIYFLSQASTRTTRVTLSNNCYEFIVYQVHLLPNHCHRCKQAAYYTIPYRYIFAQGTILTSLAQLCSQGIIIMQWRRCLTLLLLNSNFIFLNTFDNVTIIM